jgi:hypothetical protein
MVEAGMSADEGLGGFTAVVLAVIGLVLVEFTFRAGDGTSALGRRFERLKIHFQENEETEQPTTRQAFVRTPDFAVEKSFELMLTTLIAGLGQRCSKT